MISLLNFSLIMVNFPIYIDTVSMDSSIFYFRVHSLDFKLKYISAPEDCFYLSKQC